MPKTSDAFLTPQQRKWFASVRAGLERDTGKSLSEWVEIARTCPETQPRARLKWFKDTHGLLQNRASFVLSEAFPPEGGWSEPEALRRALWVDPAGLKILEAVEVLIGDWPDLVRGQRKTYSAFSRRAQFAALRPTREGACMGLAIAPDADPRLEAPRSESWSERLKSRTLISEASQVASFQALLRAAYEAS